MSRPPHFARNLAAVLAWEALWGFGNACTASAIFVPFLSHLAGSKRLVGNVGLTMLLGIPALVVSLWLAHRLKRKKVAVTILWAGQVVSWIALGALLVSGHAPSAIVPVVYVSQSVFAFVAGVSMAPTYQLLTTVFGDRFGTAQGLQLFFRQATGIAGGLWAASSLTHGDFPTNFGMTFLVGGIVLTASNVAVLFFVEPDAPAAAAREPFLPSVGRALRAARPMAAFFWVIATVAAAIAVQALLTVSALERLGLEDAHAGIFESVTLATSGVGGALAGRAGDRIGHGRALFVALGIQLVSFAAVVKLSGVAQFYVALALAGFAYAAMLINLAGLTAKLAPTDLKGAFMAIMRWISQIVSALATALAAFTVDHAGYTVLFAASLLPVALAMAVVRRFDPR